MGTKAKYTKVTQEDFELVKLLQERGLKYTEIQKITKRGAGTVHILLNSNSMEEYHATVSRQNAINTSKQSVSKPTGQPEQTKLVEDTTKEENSLEKLNASVEVLVKATERSAKALEDLVKAWETTPQEKRATLAERLRGSK